MTPFSEEEISRAPEVGRERAVVRTLGVLALVAALALAAGAVVAVDNQLVEAEVAVDTQWTQVEVQLVRQHELLPKLVAVAKRYAEHEAEVLEGLAAARSRYQSAPPSERPAQAGELDGMLVRVLALAEKYPALQASQHYQELAYEIAGTKNRIALERKRYNDLVGHYNARLRQLPWRLRAAGLEPRRYYEAPPEQLSEPELDL